MIDRDIAFGGALLSAVIAIVYFNAGWIGLGLLLAALLVCVGLRDDHLTDIGNARGQIDGLREWQNVRALPHQG